MNFSFQGIMGKCSCGLSMLNTINVYAVGLRLACLMRLKNLESQIFVLICGNGNNNNNNNGHFYGA